MGLERGAQSAHETLAGGSLTLLEGGNHTRCSHVEGTESMQDNTSGSSRPVVDIDPGDYGDREPDSLLAEACQ